MDQKATVCIGWKPGNHRLEGVNKGTFPYTVRLPFTIVKLTQRICYFSCGL